MNSRSLDFADEMLRRTGGRGVDVVLNSLTGEFIPASLGACAAAAGSWRSASAASGTRTGGRRPPATLDYPVSTSAMSRAEPARSRAMLDACWRRIRRRAAGAAAGSACSRRRGGGAFRYMAQAQHIGKIVVDRRRRPAPAAGVRARRDVPDHRRSRRPRPAGGGVAGRARRAAPGPDGPRRPSAGCGRAACAGSSGRGRVSRGRAATSRRRGRAAAALAEIAGTLPPLRGVVHAAGVLDDGVLRAPELGALRPRCWRRRWPARGTCTPLTPRLPLDFFVSSRRSPSRARLAGPGQLRRGQRLPGRPGAPRRAEGCRR